MAGSIIIVEDDKDVRTIISSFLKRENFAVDEAANVSEAISKMKEKEFNWIISDIRMLDIDGIGFVQKVKELWPDKKVILISGYVQPEHVKNLDVEGFFEKPIDMPALVSLIKSRS